MSAAEFPTLDVLDTVCRYFGGPQDPATHDYRTPTVEGLGFVRGVLQAPTDQEWALLARPGVNPGALLLVYVSDFDENRESGPTRQGWIQRRYDLDLHLYTQTVSLDPLVAGLEVYRMTDRIVAKIHQDWSLGSGGWGDGGGGLWFGEGRPSMLRVRYGTPQKALQTTQRVVTLSGVATQYVHG